MAKVVKLKQSDISKIVENILKEQQEFDDFDTKIQPEELPGNDENDDEQQGVELTIGQDEQGNYYIFKDGDTNNPEIVAKI
jgi:hypothetical protein